MTICTTEGGIISDSTAAIMNTVNNSMSCVRTGCRLCSVAHCTPVGSGEAGIPIGRCYEIALAIGMAGGCRAGYVKFGGSSVIVTIKNNRSVFMVAIC